MSFSFEQAQQLIDAEIGRISLDGQPGELYNPIGYIMQLGGKRMRPTLTLLASYMFRNETAPALKPAIAVEVFHNFTLMHDDIMDNAPLRRGKITVHEKWNPNVAILSGDVMLVKAYELLLDIDTRQLKPVLALFNRCACEVCEGQQFDMNFESATSVTIPQYLEMISLKTAALLGFSMQLGAIVGGADLDEAARFKDTGINLGMAFQLKDDLLDVFGDKKKFGKQVGGDIISNKKTYLLLKALEEADTLHREKLNYWLNRKEFDPAKKVREVRAIFEDLGIKEKTQAKMDGYVQKALDIARQLSPAEERKQPLYQFIEQVSARDK